MCPCGVVSPVWEYHLNGQWLMMDSENGYILWTGIWKGAFVVHDVRGPHGLRADAVPEALGHPKGQLLTSATTLAGSMAHTDLFILPSQPTSSR